MVIKKPQKPPKWEELVKKYSNFGGLFRITEAMINTHVSRGYPHWDKLRRLTPPQGLTSDQWWFAIKISRGSQYRPVPLKDTVGRPFVFLVPDSIQENLHAIDCGAGKSQHFSEPITNPQTRDQYLIRSFVEEAITSSQLEGAVTTREVAKEMILSGRAPRDTSEQMILNNYLTMRRIVDIKDQEMTPELVFNLHRLVTEKTLDKFSAAGRFRYTFEKRVVADMEGEVYHEPPDVKELMNRLEAMCNFANQKTPSYFIHPVVRGIILHFWLAYDHPFVDGNGRTARSLFYWAMLHYGYSLFEFISISSILRKAPVKYARSFLYTESDDNDMTYFILYQTEVIHRAIEELHTYIDKKSVELQQLQSEIKVLQNFNHRQVALLRHALKHPIQEYTIEGHQQSHNVAYQTARTDLLKLHEYELLEHKKRGKAMVFYVPPDLANRLRRLSIS
ncbi:MAG: Fic family protein [Deltaproteobacteria bacterium]|nr:Fic family protein [Deltaproteobacteria bacterium]